MGSRWMGARSEWTRPARLRTAAPEATAVAPAGAGASSGGPGAAAGASPEGEATEAMAAAASSPAAAATAAALETTTAAGVKAAATASGARAAPTGTATTATPRTASEPTAKSEDVGAAKPWTWSDHAACAPLLRPFPVRPGRARAGLGPDSVGFCRRSERAPFTVFRTWWWGSRAACDGRFYPCFIVFHFPASFWCWRSRPCAAPPCRCFPGRLARPVLSSPRSRTSRARGEDDVSRAFSPEPRVPAPRVSWAAEPLIKDRVKPAWLCALPPPPLRAGPGRESGRTDGRMHGRAKPRLCLQGDHRHAGTAAGCPVSGVRHGAAASRAHRRRLQNSHRWPGSEDGGGGGGDDEAPNRSRCLLSVAKVALPAGPGRRLLEW
ncbi:cold-inducible RNA-binding protein isoform X1 [Cavia porcellus]|uniref:cold-inducible RNA-binding protein isoform X1 n=1 Tax=Cavia porcellus TaxID=10141 RepID=UPI002FE28F64